MQGWEDARSKTENMPEIPLHKPKVSKKATKTVRSRLEYKSSVVVVVADVSYTSSDTQTHSHFFFLLIVVVCFMFE
jgi:hypothetical protein